MRHHATRLLELSDVSALTDLLIENRDFLRPWEPLRTDDFFTERRQEDLASQALEDYERGAMVPLVILNGKGDIAGRLNINGIVRGAFQSAALGYWVGLGDNGRGLATQAVREALDLAENQLGLHRLQAETLLQNAPSMRVLQKCGFAQYGMAPKYLQIAGEWQDHLLFQRIIDTNV